MEEIGFALLSALELVNDPNLIHFYLGPTRGPLEYRIRIKPRASSQQNVPTAHKRKNDVTFTFTIPLFF